MSTTSAAIPSSLCIPIKTGKRHKSAWQQWMTPISVMKSITESLCEGTSYRRISQEEALALVERSKPMRKVSWSDGDFARLPIRKAIAQATERREFEDGHLELVYKPNPRDPGIGEFIEFSA